MVPVNLVAQSVCLASDLCECVSYNVSLAMTVSSHVVSSHVVG